MKARAEAEDLIDHLTQENLALLTQIESAGERRGAAAALRDRAAMAMEAYSRRVRQKSPIKSEVSAIAACPAPQRKGPENTNSQVNSTTVQSTNMSAKLPYTKARGSNLSIVEHQHDLVQSCPLPPSVLYA